MVFFRRSRRSDPGPPPAASPPRPASSTSRRTSVSLVSKLSRTYSMAINDNDGDEGEKGPMGLSLLHAPEDPKVDFIFVHGLGGDSIKTWSRPSPDPNYWPQDWLPQDAAFEDVRIFTYGYKSDYSKGKKDCLNIHQNGQSFLAELSASPYFANSKTRIVAVGHSMGGLIIKKALLLAKQDANYDALASRFAAIYFLATPHRDADSAKLLKNILKVANERASVSDLGRNLSAIQVINDEFRHCSEGMELWSFYETQKMRRFSSPIVDPESATLGQREEKQIAMNADHGSICKFENRLDPNYLVLRDALASTVENLTTAAQRAEERARNARVEQVRTYLGVPDEFEDDLLQAEETRLKDSCQWISANSTYTNWRDDAFESGKILWVKGAAGTGKSVLTGYVVNQIQQANLPCSYFFFKRGDQSRAGLDVCLRTLAFQMAMASPEVLNFVLRMNSNGISLDNIDIRILWKRLFLDGIFTTDLERHYWAIDALDECPEASVLTEFIFPRISDSSPLKILITARDSADMDRSIAKARPGQVQTLSTTPEDTASDIKLITETKASELTVLQPEEQTVLSEKIMTKSEGSFIWTVLALEELNVFHSKKDIDLALEQLPQGIENLWKRALQIMAQGCRGNELAKAVLRWTACAFQPLTVTELNYALNIDLDDSFPMLKDSIVALCGLFIVVDKFDRVQLIHETAREVLLKADSGTEFDFSEARAHSRMAKVCLQYLLEDEMQPPSIVRRQERINARVERMEFAEYALVAYSYHLSKADAQDKALFDMVLQFAKKNILSWIEIFADYGDLGQLVRSSQHFMSYIDTLCKDGSYPTMQVRILRQWAVDLECIANKYGQFLLASPSAIYSLIPSYCPPNSMVRTASKHIRTLEILGEFPDQWDEKLFCLDFNPIQPSTMCAGRQFFAIGFTTGAVHLYDKTSYRQTIIFSHGESVKFIRFSPDNAHLATCGATMTKIWDLGTCELLHTLKSPPCPLGVDFHNEFLVVASQKNYMQHWNLHRNGALESKKQWGDSSGRPWLPSRPPTALAMSSAHNVLAIANFAQPITIWHMDEHRRFGSCGKKAPGGETSKAVVSALAFSPNPAVSLLAAAYMDGDLAVLDPFSNKQLACARIACHSMDVSADGRLLAVGTNGGVIKVYEFRTLKLLYQTEANTLCAKQVKFISDGVRFADIRATQCTIWQPSATSQGVLAGECDKAAPITSANVSSMDAKPRITAIEPHDSEDILFCGTEDGKIGVYCRKTATCLKELPMHNCPVTLLRWCRQREALLSVDATNRITLMKLLKMTEKGWQVEPVVQFQSVLDCKASITDVLIGEAVDKFIVSTSKSDYLFTLDGNQLANKACKDRMGVCKWMPHLSSPELAIRLDGGTARVYRWNDWSETWASYFSLSSEPFDLQSSTLCSLAQKKVLLLELSESNAAARTNNFMILNVDRFGMVHEYTGTEEKRPYSASIHEKEAATAPPPCPRTGHLPHIVSRVIGMSGTDKLVFLDFNSWICSISIGESEQRIDGGGDVEYERHCFIPHDWFSGWENVCCTIVQGDLIFARHGELTILKGCFDFTERVVFGK